MNKKIDIRVLLIGIFLMLFSILPFWVAVHYQYQEFVGYILGGILLVVGFIHIVIATYGDKIMKSMYGEFSNRNPWGR